MGSRSATDKGDVVKKLISVFLMAIVTLVGFVPPSVAHAADIWLVASNAQSGEQMAAKAFAYDGQYVWETEVNPTGITLLQVADWANLDNIRVGFQAVGYYIRYAWDSSGPGSGLYNESQLVAFGLTADGTKSANIIGRLYRRPANIEVTRWINGQLVNELVASLPADGGVVKVRVRVTNTTGKINRFIVRAGLYGPSVGEADDIHNLMGKRLGETILQLAPGETKGVVFEKRLPATLKRGYYSVGIEVEKGWLIAARDFYPILKED